MSALSRPIGVFDSGVGGLSVVREIQTLLPAEQIIYVSDARYLPYGDRDSAFVCERSLAIATALDRMNAGLLVVACNTATAVAVAQLRANFGQPVVAIEPAVKPAAAATRSGIVGVLATAGTLASARYADLIRRFGQFTRVINQPCPGLVECVEALPSSDARARSLLREYVQPLLDAGADTLVLGCTHYPFLMPQLRDIVGPDVHLIDPGKAVARQVEQLLPARASGPGGIRCFTTGDPHRQQQLISMLLEREVEVSPYQG